MKLRGIPMRDGAKSEGSVDSVPGSEPLAVANA